MPVSFSLAIRKDAPCNVRLHRSPGLWKYLLAWGEKYKNSRACSLSPSSVRGSTAAKSEAGWRFAPACCAAQPVTRARRRSAVLSSTPSPFLQVVEALRINEIKRGNKCPVSQFAQVSRRHLSEPPRKPLALRRPCASNGSCSPFGFFHSHQ